MNIKNLWESWPEAEAFSGVFSASGENGVLFEKASGYRNRSERLPNNTDTAFGIASGTKMFTGLTVCMMIDSGMLSLGDRLSDVLQYDLGDINQNITIHNLLTHTSGVGDYIDEEAPNSNAQMLELYRKYPVYLWERLEYYLPMITALPPKFEPGARFGYSNSGYVLLGLVIEAISGRPYQEAVRDKVISPLGLRHTGFYAMNQLPQNTAHGYVEEAGRWRTNIFDLPFVGGADGGLYTCAKDLDTLWRALFAGELLSEPMLRQFLSPQIHRDEKRSYGLGVYRYDDEENTAFYAVGGDFGVDFFTAFFPKQAVAVSAFSNNEADTYPLFKLMLAQMNGADGEA